MRLKYTPTMLLPSEQATRLKHLLKQKSAPAMPVLTPAAAPYAVVAAALLLQCGAAHTAHRCSATTTRQHFHAIQLVRLLLLLRHAYCTHTAAAM
jgi:hypothetical protein